MYTKKEESNKNETNSKAILCRPRFSSFDMFSRRIYSALKNNGNSLNLNVIGFPHYERNDHTPRYSLIVPSSSRQKILPVGFGLNDCEKLSKGDMPCLRIRGKDAERLENLQHCLHEENKFVDERHSDLKNKRHLCINAVFFPLLSTLISRWEKNTKEKFGNVSRKVKKVVILVSGVGTPRNYAHSISANSTKYCAELMEIFLKKSYPNLTVVKIHSETNIFRYDENIIFTKQELMPCIDAYRDAHACNHPYPDEISPPITDRILTNFNMDWKQSLHVSL